MTKDEKIRRSKEVAELVSFNGWKWILDEITEQISLIDIDLETKHFKDLREVDKLQNKIQIYRNLLQKIDDWVEEGKKLSSK